MRKMEKIKYANGSQNLRTEWLIDTNMYKLISLSLYNLYISGPHYQTSLHYKLH